MYAKRLWNPWATELSVSTNVNTPQPINIRICRKRWALMLLIWSNFWRTTSLAAWKRIRHDPIIQRVAPFILGLMWQKRKKSVVTLSAYSNGLRPKSTPWIGGFVRYWKQITNRHWKWGCISHESVVEKLVVGIFEVLGYIHIFRFQGRALPHNASP